jgi:uncharacterized protein (DUF2147 family)
MKRLFCTAAILAASLGAAHAAEPILGDWMVKDNLAYIRIVNCAGKLWGVVAWEKEPGFDVNNPDPAKRNKPLLGSPVLRAMAPTKPNLWEGQVYNSNDGKLYMAKISLSSPDVLKLEGCILGGWFCGGESWTRVKGPEAPAPTKATKGAKAVQVPNGLNPHVDICSTVAENAGPSH